MEKEGLSQKLAFKERSTCKILYLRELKDSSFYMAIMAKFVATVFLFYVSISTVIVLENYIIQSNETHKICGKYKHTKHIKPKRHKYTWFTQFGLRPPQSTSPSFLLSSKMKRHNLQQIHCNIPCSLSQSPSLFLTPRIHIQYTADIQYPHKSEGFPSREKSPKLNIDSTVRSFS